MWTKNKPENEARNWLIAIAAFIVVFVLLSVFAVVSGVDNEQLDSAVKEVETLEAQTKEQTDEEALALREERLATTSGLNEQLSVDLSELLTEKDFDDFGETYGQELATVLETELTNAEYSDVEVMNQPLMHSTGVYPLTIVFDNHLHLFVYYDFQTDTIEPQYVHRESEVE